MIDWHSHILPKMDDGSRSVAESVEMLKMLGAQGVSTVVATPHFYVNNEPVESFFERRTRSYEELCKEWHDPSMQIVLGTEVRYYPGISRLSALEDLRIDGTRLLLLEMPERIWSEYTVREIEEMSCSSRVRVLLAHVERCLPQQKADVSYRLAECGVLMQSNAEYFYDVLTRRRALKALREGRIDLIGSDCHDLDKRPPTLDRAYDMIKRKLGEDFVVGMQEFGRSLFDLK